MTLHRSADMSYPHFRESLPSFDEQAGRYVLRFARTRSELKTIQQLRFDVFNLELGEGLDTSFQSGRDEDDLDRFFHHLMIMTADLESVVGTYRLQTAPMATTSGFYSTGEFDLSALPEGILQNSVEIGRGCVAKAHRNGRVLHHLWKGIASYLTWNRKRFLFGCCSLPTLDVSVAHSALGFFMKHGHMHPTVRVSPIVSCLSRQPHISSQFDHANIPPLFQSYLKLGAKVCGPPAIDYAFKTTDFFVLLDTNELQPRVHHTFFRDASHGQRRTSALVSA